MCTAHFASRCFSNAFPQNLCEARQEQEPQISQYGMGVLLPSINTWLRHQGLEGFDTMWRRHQRLYQIEQATAKLLSLFSFFLRYRECWLCGQVFCTRLNLGKCFCQTCQDSILQEHYDLSEGPFLPEELVEKRSPLENCVYELASFDETRRASQYQEIGDLWGYERGSRRTRQGGLFPSPCLPRGLTHSTFIRNDTELLRRRQELSRRFFRLFLSEEERLLHRQGQMCDFSIIRQIPAWKCQDRVRPQLWYFHSSELDAFVLSAERWPNDLELGILSPKIGPLTRILPNLISQEGVRQATGLLLGLLEDLLCEYEPS